MEEKNKEKIIQQLEENSKKVDEELDALEKASNEQQEQYVKQMMRYQTYNKVMRYIAFTICIVAVLGCLIGGICMIAINLGVGAIVAGAIMLLLAPIIASMLFFNLYYEKHPEKLKAYIMKRANKMREKQQRKEEKRKNKGNK